LDLTAQVPADKILITESGIHMRDDVITMTDAGIYGFLVGESFMRAASPGAKLKELMFGE
jgi:indole-3-glycerol phosphate synthase